MSNGRHVGARPREAPVILLYHSVQRIARDPWGVRVSPRNFAEHMAVIRAVANPISLQSLDQKLIHGDLPQRAVLVTFDDGYADNLQHALPSMERYQIPATVFVATGYVESGCEYWWDELDRLLLQAGHLPDEIELEIGGERHRWSLNGQGRMGRLRAWRARHWRAWNAPVHPRQCIYRETWKRLREAEPQIRDAALQLLRHQIKADATARSTHRPLTVAELRQLAAGSNIEIGAHTVNHPSLGHIKAEIQQREIVQSKAWLEEALDRPITSFSYPFGTKDDYTEATIGLLKDAGFKRSCSNFPGLIDCDIDRFQYPRRVVLDWTGREFSQKLAKWFAE